MRENTQTELTKKQKLLGAQTICRECAKFWKEHHMSLNGNQKNRLMEIDRRGNEKTLRNPSVLWEMVEEKKKNTGKNIAISKIILNAPGIWEASFPTLSRIAIKEQGNFVYYDEIDSLESLERIVNYLKIGATNKISLLLC